MERLRKELITYIIMLCIFTGTFVFGVMSIILGTLNTCNLVLISCGGGCLSFSSMSIAKFACEVHFALKRIIDYKKEKEE